MKIFTLALFSCAFLGAYAQEEMIYEDDFSWLNSPEITSSADLYTTTNEGTNQFLPDTIAKKGIKNPGWLQGVFDLNDDHTLRLAPNGDKEPENFFAYPYNTVYMRPGYLKIGYTNFAGAIISPAFEKLGDRIADVEVTLRMCGYTSAGSEAKPGNKDAANVYVGLWDGSDGSVEDADYEQMASGWTYETKTIKVTNYHESKYKEYGENYNVWDDSRSLYTVRLKNVSAKTRLYIFCGGYGTEIKGRTTPSTVDLPINDKGETMTFNYKPNINRIGLKGCYIKLLQVTGGGSGVDEIEVDDNAPAEYFNLQGIRVAHPQKGGIYIKRQGGKAEKVAL